MDETLTDFPQGMEIRFKDAAGELVGIINGEPYYLDEDIGPYIPVYVRATDQCMIVHALNVTPGVVGSEPEVSSGAGS